MGRNGRRFDGPMLAKYEELDDAEEQIQTKPSSGTAAVQN